MSNEQGEVRLVAMSATEAKHLRALTEGIISHRDALSYADRARRELAKDANLVSSLADRFDSGITEAEAAYAVDRLCRVVCTPRADHVIDAAKAGNDG